MAKQHIPLKAKLASALLQMVRPNDKGEFERIIPHEDAKQMTDEQVISLFQFDHDPIREADGGQTIGWNLTPRLIVAHRIKTAKKDIPEMAKAKRIRDDQEAFQRRLLARDRGEERPRSRWLSRPLRSRGFR